ncbi:hypothetical protein QVA66_00610 [Staphylococcus chromogenes]|nr:hypothetical protein [Staphylococcus chromogenes]
MSAATKEWDHYVTYTLSSGQQGHIVLRTAMNPSDRLLKDALSRYGLDPADIKKVAWVPVPSVRQSAVFAQMPMATNEAPRTGHPMQIQHAQLNQAPHNAPRVAPAPIMRPPQPPARPTLTMNGELNLSKIAYTIFFVIFFAVVFLSSWF